MTARIKKGDKVTVISGRDKGKIGEVLKLNLSDQRAIVQGVNMIKRHTRPSGGTAGGIVEKEASIHLSNILNVDPKDQTPTRIGIKILKDGKKVRFAKKSGEIIDT